MKLSIFLFTILLASPAHAYEGGEESLAEVVQAVEDLPQQVALVDKDYSKPNFWTKQGIPPCEDSQIIGRLLPMKAPDFPAHGAKCY